MSKTCLDCPFHKVIADPDPHDWFCDDDQAIICLKTKNEEQDENASYVSNRSEFKSVTNSCRPYNLKKETTIPEWCPLIT
jgi:hypothetical protein